MVVIPTRGCTWALSKNGGCSMCGYINDSSRDQSIPVDNILDKIRNFLKSTNPDKSVEIRLFNSGSFFDNLDVPEDLRKRIISLINNYSNVKKLIVESRPQYLIKFVEVIKEVKKSLDPIELEIGVGLESSNDAILRDCWNKGTTLEKYEIGVQKIRSLDIRIKSYILIKPPFLTERESIIDAIKTTRKAIEIGTDVISYNPCNVQNGTLVHYLYNQDRYQPPWLWSVLLILRTIRDEFPDLEIICEPNAAGKPRGAHNCGKCDKLVLNLIDKVIQNTDVPTDLSEVCSCFLKWQYLILNPIEALRTRNLSKLRQLNPLRE